MTFTENANRIFNQAIADYHIKDNIDTPINNPFAEGTIENRLYLKCWIDTVQWHLEDIIRDENISPEEALKIKRRSVQLPMSCQNCEHFNDCEGGCMRDSVLYNHGLYGKFHYCHSWKMVFTRIKESIMNGEADGIVRQFGLEPEEVRNRVKNKLVEYFDFSMDEIQDIKENGTKNKLGFGDNYFGNTSTNYNIYGEYENKKGSMNILSSIKDDEYNKANERLKGIKVTIVNQ